MPTMRLASHKVNALDGRGKLQEGKHPRCQSWLNLSFAEGTLDTENGSVP